MHAAVRRCSRDCAGGNVRLRILIADDAAPLRAVFVRIASVLGHVVVGEAADAETALRLVADLIPDVVVLDGRLPPEGALVVLSRVRAIVPAATIFVIAALGETALVRDAVAAGAQGIIARPLLVHRVAASLSQEPPL